MGAASTTNCTVCSSNRRIERHLQLEGAHVQEQAACFSSLELREPSRHWRGQSVRLVEMVCTDEDRVASAGSDEVPDVETAQALVSMAASLKEGGYFSQAEGLERQLLRTYMASLGQSHPRTLEVLGCLAVTLRARRHYEHALVIEERRLEAFRDFSGYDHPDTLEVMGDMGATLVALGRLADAADLLRERLQFAKVIFGELAPHTLLASWSLAATLRQLGRCSEAFDLFRHCLQASKFAQFEEAVCTPVVDADALEDGHALEEAALRAVELASDKDTYLQHAVHLMLQAVLDAKVTPGAAPSGSSIGCTDLRFVPAAA